MKHVWIFFGCFVLSGAIATPAATENAPGVTDREIKIGQTMPYTGPAAPFSAPGLAEKAYMQLINDQGGINGRKINLISVDDGYLPWRTGNETRKLIEVEQVAFTFGSIGTPTQLLVAKRVEHRGKKPQQTALWKPTGARVLRPSFGKGPTSTAGPSPTYLHPRTFTHVNI